MNERPIHHDPIRQRFEATVEGLPCEASYRLADGVMHLVHTAVPHALSVRVIAAALVKQALAEARAQRWRVRPVCSYVRAYMRRHPDTLDLLEA